MSDASGNLAAHFHNQPGMLTFRRNRHIADPLSGDRQGLAEGIAGNGVFVILCHIGGVHPVKHNLPVGLVGNQVDFMAVRFLLLLQNGGQLPDGFCGINGSRRIVGRIDQHRRHILRHHVGKFVKIHLKAGQIRRNHFQAGSGQIHIEPVFREKRGEGENGVPRHRHRPEGMGQSRSRAAGHENVFLFVGHTESAIQGIRHRLPDGIDPQRGTVAVKSHRAFLLQQILHLPGKFFRHRHRRISQTVIKDIFRPDFLSPFCSVSRHLPDGRFCSQHGFILFCNHSFFLSLYPQRTAPRPHSRNPVLRFLSVTALFLLGYPGSADPAEDMESEYHWRQKLL